MPSSIPSNLATRDIESLVHPYTNLAAFREAGPLIIERGQGIYVYDTAGRAYIDGMAGLWCTALGWGNEELADTAAAQMRKLAFGHLFGGKSHDGAIELAEKLKEIAPVPTSKVFFCNSGSEANDTQIKLIWYMNNALGRERKKKIVSRRKGYHGVTIAAASLTGLPANQTDFDVPIANIVHTGCPHHYRFAHDGESEQDFATRLAAELDDLIQREGPDTVAAFFVEPVMGAGGVIVPPATYFDKVMAVCAKYDVYVVCDEVICGFGRLGTQFGCQAFGFEPHSITVAKALTSAYVPMAAVTVPEVMYQAMLDESRKIGTFGHGFTYSGHPVAAAVALKALAIYERERLVEKAARMTPQFQGRLAKLAAHPLVGEARGYGLVGAVETGRGQGHQAFIRSEGGRRGACRVLCRSGRTAASVPCRRCPIAVPAVGDHAGGTGRDVRPAGPGARSHPGLGQARGRAAGLVVRFRSSSTLAARSDTNFGI